MLKKLLAVSLVFITATETVAMTVEHGLFGTLNVVDYRQEIQEYNDWCLSQKQHVDDTVFLAKSCAEKCFKFDTDNSPDHFSRAEAEDLLKSISKNPVAASAMKVLISKYLKYADRAEGFLTDYRIKSFVIKQPK